MKAAIRLLAMLALVVPSFASAQTATVAPTCTLKASAATVAPNTRVRLDWTSKNATAGYLNEVGQIPSAGFAYVVPGKNTTYAASFTGPGGSVVCRTAVVVSSSPIQTSGGGGSGTSGGGGTITNPPVNVPNVTLPTAQSVGLTPPTGNGFSGGIVPLECRGKNTIANCDLCSLAQMIQNAANFMLGLSVPAAALLFAWAGIRLFAARGVAEHINAAKKIFKTVVIGFLIIVSVWTLVNVVMNSLLKGGELGTWDWRTLDCSAVRGARLYNMSIKDYLKTSLPTLSGYTNPAPILSGGSAFGTQCPYGGTMSSTEGGNVCTTDAGQSYPAQSPTPAAGCSVGGELTVEGYCVRSDGLVYTPGTGSSNSVNGGVTGSGVAGGGGSSSVTLTEAQAATLYESCEEDEVKAACDIIAKYENVPEGGKVTLTAAEKEAIKSMCKEDEDQDMCALSNTAAVSNNVGTVVNGLPSNNTDCSADNIQAAAAAGGYNLTDSQANTLSCIAVPESACGRNTSVATTPDGRVTSATGMFQIVFGAGNDQCHNLNIPVCTDVARAAGYDVSGNLNCYSHFRAGKPIDAIGEACRAAASNISCNASAAACLVQARGGKFSDWTADSRSSKQQSCIDKYGG